MRMPFTDRLCVKESLVWQRRLSPESYAVWATMFGVKIVGAMSLKYCVDKEEFPKLSFPAPKSTAVSIPRAVKSWKRANKVFRHKS